MLRKLASAVIAIGVISSLVFVVQQANADIYGTCTVTSSTVITMSYGDKVITTFDCGGGYTRTCYLTYYRDGRTMEVCETYKDGLFHRFSFED